MPELPEVETVARQLDVALRGRNLHALKIYDEKLAATPTRSIRDRCVTKVTRLGKQIALELAPRGREKSPLLILVHLRMSGRLIWEAAPGKAHSAAGPGAAGRRAALPGAAGRGAVGPEKHVRARFSFNGGEVKFVDPRRFGTITVVSVADLAAAGALDALSEELTHRKLVELLAKSKQPIKPWLLRQDRLLGIGNIYACEILFASHIDPRRPASSLTAPELKSLRGSLRRVLRRAIELGGTTFSDYQRTDGTKGGFQRLLKVYDREGSRCRRCGGSIQRIVQAGRSTFFCPDCQQ